MVTGMRGDRARSLLAGSRFADLQWVGETGSTNRDLAVAAAAGAPDGTVLVADHQTAGRGRLDRTWVAPPGSSLLLSVLVRPDLDPADAPLLTVALALGLLGTQAATAVGAGLKWPNDVVIAPDEPSRPPRKLAGILAESMEAPDGTLAVVVGMGVNVNWPRPVPAELVGLSGPGGMATALNVELGAEVDRQELLAEVLTGFEACIDELEGPGGRSQLLARAARASVTLGRQVRAELQGEVVEGTAVELDDGGDLVVVDDRGRRHTIGAGDVVHLRSAPRDPNLSRQRRPGRR